MSKVLRWWTGIPYMNYPDDYLHLCYFDYCLLVGIWSPGFFSGVQQIFLFLCFSALIIALNLKYKQNLHSYQKIVLIGEMAKINKMKLQIKSNIHLKRVGECNGWNLGINTTKMKIVLQVIHGRRTILHLRSLENIIVARETLTKKNKDKDSR